MINVSHAYFYERCNPTTLLQGTPSKDYVKYYIVKMTYVQWYTKKNQ